MFKSFHKKFIIVPLMAVVLFSAGIAVAADNKIHFASVSWTGVTIKTELGVSILESLGYEVKYSQLSVPIVYKALDMGDADIFLGNWMPSMANIAEKFFEKGTIEKYVANMPGAKYTLAAPAYVVDGGLKDFSDIADYADKLGHKIYGIEPGNDGNQIILDMIKKDMFGLGDFQLIQTSESIMLTEMKILAQQGKWAVFLGWAPHYMNSIIDMKYLTGSTAETFGENNGTATVYTNIRQGFAGEHPNVARFLENFIFPIPMMNEISKMLNDNKKLSHGEAALIWVKNNPEIYRGWFEQVETIDGEPALQAFEVYLQTI